MSSDKADDRNPGSAPARQITTFDKPAPVAVTERITSIDTLRGFALLGILVINIDVFALPGVVFFAPQLAGGFTGLNLATWSFGSMFFLNKMMAIFSMLFGAGLVLMYERFEARGQKFGRIHYRRIFWLLVIALIHGYLLWYGDILFAYSICAFLLFLFRRRSARFLIWSAVAVLCFGMILQAGTGGLFYYLRGEAAASRERLAQGEEIAEFRQGIIKSWDEIQANFNPSPEKITGEINAYRGGFSDVFNERARATFEMQTSSMIYFIFWRAAGLILLGMGLMKLGVFSGKRKKNFYTRLIIFGYGLGLPMTALATYESIQTNFDIILQFAGIGQLNYIGSILVALGHVGLIITLFRSGVLSGLAKRLAAVGRMALTNYLMHSIICTTLFYGYGFGLFNRIERIGLLGIVVLVWIFQLIISPIWLKKYRFGPAEWLWRTLTYWRKQPMKIA